MSLTMSASPLPTTTFLGCCRLLNDNQIVAACSYQHRASSEDQHAKVGVHYTTFENTVTFLLQPNSRSRRIVTEFPLVVTVIGRYYYRHHKPKQTILHKLRRDEKNLHQHGFLASLRTWKEAASVEIRPSLLLVGSFSHY